MRNTWHCKSLNSNPCVRHAVNLIVPAMYIVVANVMLNMTGSARF